MIRETMLDNPANRMAYFNELPQENASQTTRVTAKLSFGEMPHELWHRKYGARMLWEECWRILQNILRPDSDKCLKKTRKTTYRTVKRFSAKRNK